MQPVVLFLGVSFLLLLTFYTYSLYSSEVCYVIVKYTYQPINISWKHGDDKNASTCVLTELDPFDDAAWEFMDPMLGENQRKTCNQKFVARTSLENGQLKQSDQNDHCWGRCLHYTFSSRKYKKDEWISTKQNHTFACDIIESLCSKTNESNAADYGYLHTQIHELKEKLVLANSKPKSKTYNVLLMVLDSTSFSMARRNLPSTLGYLKSEMGAVEFKFLNRVGIHSKQNGAALLIGRRAEPVSQFDSESPKWEYNMNLDDFIRKGMDEYPQIHKNFSNEGYVTFLGEDWSIPVFSQALAGYKKPIADHTSHPFVTARELGSQTLRNTLAADNCADKHSQMIDYTEQFIRSYEGVPKFGSYWDADWAHDDQVSLVPADNILHRFFERNKDYLNDTFVFITGDHGPKYGNFVKTRLGAMETDNPMLIIVPPKQLRENKELMDTLRENSEKLQTHWDSRATLFDIMKHQPSSNFTDRSPLAISKDGSSMLRRQEGERSCRTLPIPIEYCLCRYPTEEKNIYSIEARYFAQQVLESVEEKLKNKKVANLCNKWTIKEVLRLTEVTVSSGKILHQITIALKSPDGAQFKSMVSETNGTLYVSSVDRLDAYKNRGNCVHHDLSPICDCM